ncbi:hypothetical protein CEN41_09645 [Fischerella thermalis CCMEE 5330]|uniref:Uncharacterized protein n=1 Tax=Fischerella thermalis CCMEE 5330 TaxID=2019670 RepID=A0A2N6MDG3_9CYAN|nr:hypothetical protein CEN41_09645 [Fischerella thermalis CCMEE 5330]BAU06088.1 hypothetical protein FIS3754_19990 [Fischerella sp. NIES-3754]BCX08372.1 MAG: hypothetical protein KatS3mg066_2231 [Fischerella sp.]
MDETAHHPVIGDFLLPITHYLLAITRTTPLPKYGRIPQNLFGGVPSTIEYNFILMLTEVDKTLAKVTFARVR